MSENFEIGQPVKHLKHKLNEAKFVGYTKKGRARVVHNIAYPYGVTWMEDAYKPENIVRR